jgi:hypothetical protein
LAERRKRGYKRSKEGLLEEMRELRIEKDGGGERRELRGARRELIGVRRE